MKDALRRGGSKLDCYDGPLVELWKSCGFAEKGRIAWDERYKPTLWLGGTPDVVEMVYAT